MCSENASDGKIASKVKRQDFAIVAINIKEPISRVKNFVSNNNLTFIALLDSDGDITKSFNVFATPTTFILGLQSITRTLIEVVPTQIGILNFHDIHILW
jgi:peroxiredoxin